MLLLAFLLGAIWSEAESDKESLQAWRYQLQEAQLVAAFNSGYAFQVSSFGAGVGSNSSKWVPGPENAKAMPAFQMHKADAT